MQSVRQATPLYLTELHADRSQYIAAAAQGAHVVLQHLGKPTEEQAVALKAKIESLGRECLLVSGDISLPETSRSHVPPVYSKFRATS